MISTLKTLGIHAHAIPSAVRWVRLDEEPRPVEPPPGIVYSCRPRVGTADDSAEYYVKGPDRVVVLAEHLGYKLAELVGLPTPECALVRLPEEGGVLFASRKLRVRSGVDEFLDNRLVTNMQFVSECFAFDTWIANEDRNVNNVVAEPAGGHASAIAELRAIDFEKALVLRGVDRFTVTARPRGNCRPGHALRPYCGNVPSPEMCLRIQNVTREALARVFSDAAVALGDIDWRDQGVDVLATRAVRIHALVKEECDA